MLTKHYQRCYLVENVIVMVGAVCGFWQPATLPFSQYYVLGVKFLVVQYIVPYCTGPLLLLDKRSRGKKNPEKE